MNSDALHYLYLNTLPKITIEPGKVIPFEQLPPHSIALDGYVSGPAIDTVQQRYSFDHHGNCLRLVTRATCAQVYDALQLGLNPQPFEVFINDLDGDTLFAVWLLLHPDQIHLPQVMQLVTDIDKVDAHGPAYTALFDSQKVKEYFQCVLQSKSLAVKLKSSNEQTRRTVLYHELGQALERLSAFFDGLQFATEPPEAIEYQIEYQGSHWIMVQSQQFVFAHLYAKGYQRIVAYQVLTHADQSVSYAYTIGKKSDLVDQFDLPSILAALNQLELGWGGGSSIGGAPRHADGRRSQLSPEQVAQVIEHCLLHQGIR